MKIAVYSDMPLCQPVGEESGYRHRWLTYLHTDHLGSVSVSTNSTGTLLGSQEFDPWGKTRTALGGGAQVTETKLNYTGQKKDSTGLLYYHARMYDPALGRFVSPDSIVPGASSGVGGAGGTVGQEENSKLTVDFHESGFLTSVAGENATTLQKGFWFHLRGEDKQKVREPWGPGNPQALGRYSYVLNNPVRYIDPAGHARLNREQALLLHDQLDVIIQNLQSQQTFGWVAGAVITEVIAGAIAKLFGGGLGAIAGLLGTLITGINVLTAGEIIGLLQFIKGRLNTFLLGTEVGDTSNWIAMELDSYPGCEHCLQMYSSLPGFGRENPFWHKSLPDWLWYQVYLSRTEGLPAINFTHRYDRPRGGPQAF